MLFTILGEYVLPLAGKVWSRALLRGLATLEIEEKTARQAISRTSAAGWLISHREGRRVAWQLTGAAEGLLKQGAERIYGFSPLRHGWDGSWLMLRANVPEERRELRHKLRTQLAWAGFGSLGNGLWISPDTSREQEVQVIVSNLGLADRTASFILRAGSMGAESDLISEAWDLDGLRTSYEDFVRRYQALRAPAPEEAFRALTLMVHDWRRHPFMDPGLPESILPKNWPGSRARMLFAERRKRWFPAAIKWFVEQSDPKGARGGGKTQQLT